MSVWSDGLGNWPRLNSTLSRVIAALLGALIATVLLTLCITLWWPFGDAVEQIFAGGVFFFVFWAGFFYWALLSRSGLQAWRRMLTLMAALALINALHFIGG